jgi:hypothetical protein
MAEPHGVNLGSGQTGCERSRALRASGSSQGLPRLPSRPSPARVDIHGRLELAHTGPPRQLRATLASGAEEVTRAMDGLYGNLLAAGRGVT